MNHFRFILLLSACLFHVSCASRQIVYDQTVTSEGVPPAGMDLATRSVLAAFGTIAFVPPDECVDIDVVGLREQDPLIGAWCGAIMSTLESEAMAAGWTVVGWRALGVSAMSEPQVALERAREHSVDLLVQVNEFRWTAVDVAVDEFARIRFVTVSRDERTTRPLRIAERHVPLCVDKVRDALVVAPLETIGLDAQFVRVADGAVLHHYREVVPWLSERTITERFRFASRRNRCIYDPVPLAGEGRRPRRQSLDRVTAWSINRVGLNSSTNEDDLRRRIANQLLASMVAALGTPPSGRMD